MDLPVKYRIVIHLFYYEDMSVRDISNILKINENSIRSTLHRGRNMLKKVLEVEYEYMGV
jgi:RNA polymerase sigma-70 factor (ECF subfamily)